jgi:transposase
MRDDWTGQRGSRFEIRNFGTTVAELKQARAWILAQGCTDVIMESTGTYGKPVFNVLEGHVRVALANPQEVKARQGHKTDNKDAWWLAHLLRHAMVTPSFIPPRPQRELRDLTRRRRKLIQTASAEKNRGSKVLEDGNGKLGRVLSDVFGVSGQWMLEALLGGKADAAQIASFAKARAKKKIPDLIAALEEHHLTDHHRMMIRFSLEHMRFLEEQLAEIDEQIRQRLPQPATPSNGSCCAACRRFRKTPPPCWRKWDPTRRNFPMKKHLASWSGLCPGNNRSAGRSKSSHTNPGNAGCGRL